jgi:putative nucleotidyltransferase with HDIG domain
MILRRRALVPITTRMSRLAQLRRRLLSVTVTPDADRGFDDARTRLHERLRPSERVSRVVLAAGFLAAALALVLIAPSGHVSPGTAVMLVAGLAILSRVELALASGFAVPTQLVFVPMLFLLPPADVPLLAGAALVLGRAVDVVTGRRHIARVFIGLVDAWYSLAPAVVFAAASIHGVHAADWPWWLLAFASGSAVDALASCTAELLRIGRWPRLHLRELAVVWLVDAGLAPVGLLAAAVAFDQPLAVLGVLPLAGLIAVLAQERRVRLEQAVELSSAYQGVALLLGEVIEDDDHYTGEHSRGVVALSVETARELGLGERDQRLVEFGALLHDVGKLRVPNEIINKPGPLDDDEWAIMRRHTIDGEAMLAPVGGMMHEVGRIVRGSHEDWDGTGYPDGIAGEQIPLASRIVSAADAYSAMTTDRSYRRALGHDKAVAELRRCAGTQFDPDVVAALVRVASRAAAPPPEALVVARAAALAAVPESAAASRPRRGLRRPAPAPASAGASAGRPSPGRRARTAPRAPRPPRR